MQISSKAILLCLFLGTTSAFAETHTLSLFFAGDLMQHEGQLNAALQKDGTYDYADNFKYMKPAIEAADLAIVNFEVTLGGKPYTGYPAFSAPDAYFYATKEAGFDIYLTANNHCLDRGKNGLIRTIHVMDSLNTPHLGTYTDTSDRATRYPLLVQKNGFKIALLNYTYGTNGIETPAPTIVNRIDTIQIKQDIVKAQGMNPDVIIANMHWGIEYQIKENAEQDSLDAFLLRNGVTHVIGSHPHVLQPMKIVMDSLDEAHIVVFSLGNLISNMKKRYTDGGISVLLTLEKNDTDKKVHVKSTSYSLWWVLRPEFTGKNFEIIPATLDSIPEAAKANRAIFLNDAREILKGDIPEK